MTNLRSIPFEMLAEMTQMKDLLGLLCEKDRDVAIERVRLKFNGRRKCLWSRFEWRKSMKCPLHWT